MPLRPGTNLSIKDSPPPLTLPTDSGVIFMVGISEKGPLAPVTSRTPTEWQNNQGARNTNTQLAYDSAEFLYKEGVKKIVTSRVVGPGAVVASIAVTDAGAATVFTVKAKGPGAYGNDLNAVIRTTTQDPNIAATNFRIRVQRDDGVTILEESPDLPNKQAAEYWMDTVSAWLTYTDGASALNPAAATYALAGGNDDIAGITDAQWQAAIDRFSMDLGTGILIAPGRTSDPGHVQLKTHAESFNRVTFLDAPDTPTIATLSASAAAVRSRKAGMFWPWVRVPGLTASSVRTVPPSVIAAGIAGRNDSLGYSPNKAAAGPLGVSRTAVGLTQDATVVTDANHAILNAAGVNVIRNRFGQFKVMGYRTTVSEAIDPKWVNLGGSRLACAIENGAWLVGERFLFREIDGKGQTVGEFCAAIAGEVLMPFYLAGSLYGDSPDAAFRVDGSANTDATAQNRQLLVDMVVVESEFGEEIDISFAKNLITEGV